MSTYIPDDFESVTLEEQQPLKQIDQGPYAADHFEAVTLEGQNTFDFVYPGGGDTRVASGRTAVEGGDTLIDFVLLRSVVGDVSIAAKLLTTSVGDVVVTIPIQKPRFLLVPTPATDFEAVELKEFDSFQRDYDPPPFELVSMTSQPVFTEDDPVNFDAVVQSAIPNKAIDDRADVVIELVKGKVFAGLADVIIRARKSRKQEIDVNLTVTRIRESVGDLLLRIGKTVNEDEILPAPVLSILDRGVSLSMTDREQVVEALETYFALDQTEKSMVTDILDRALTLDRKGHNAN